MINRIRSLVMPSVPFLKLLTLVTCIGLTYPATAQTTSAARDINKPVALLRPIDTLRVRELAAVLPEKPRGFGEPYTDRTAWNKLYSDPKYRAIINEAAQLISKPFPAWSDSLYLVFFRQGTRPEGEKMIRARTNQLPTLVWAECLENKGRFVPALETALTELIHQKSWVLPAHDRNRLNFDQKRFNVDLSSSKLSHSIAQAVYLLGDKLKSELRADILNELNRRTFRPILNTIATRNGDHYWLTVNNNWNAVCLAGVTGAAMAVLPNRTDRARFISIAEHYAKNSIAGFTDEGYSTEGLGYFAYGFGNYALLRETVWQATSGKVDLFADPKVKRIGMLVPNLEIMNGVYPAIADCRMSPTAPADLLWYCNRTMNLGLPQYNTYDFSGQADDLLDDIMHAFPNSATIKRNVPDSKAAPNRLRSYFADAQLLITRPANGSGGRLGTALQGGNNNEMHNHNDIGSFNVVVGDELLMGDPGGPYAYTAKTFTAERYTLYKSLASYGHPVPRIAGIEQRDGAAAQAVILATDFTDKQDRYAMDITSAYAQPHLKKLVRTFTYNREKAGSLTVADNFQFTEAQPVELALITRVDWKQIAPDQIEFTGKRERMIATISASNGPFTVRSERIEENSPAFTRVGLLFDPVKTGTITITFRPASPRK
ncbi:hypothetical protein [Fibrella aquatica]|uniref:hypothetical protein n=1 Tax=Fibrella aquatica TaxID=3242487 RepID=UPI003521DA01